MLWKNNFLRVNPLSNVSWCPCALLIPFLTVKRMLLINRWTQTVHYKIKSIYWQSISYPFVEETNPTTILTLFGTLLVHTSQRGVLQPSSFFFFFFCMAFMPLWEVSIWKSSIPTICPPMSIHAIDNDYGLNLFFLGKVLRRKNKDYIPKKLDN